MWNRISTRLLPLIRTSLTILSNCTETRAIVPITVSYGQKVKLYLLWVTYIAISFQMNQLKYVYKNSDLQFQLHIQLILKSIFLVQTWVLQGRLGLHFHSFFMVVFLMVCLCKSYFYSSSPEYKLWLSAILISHIHHTSLLTFQHKMSQPHCLLQKPLAIYNVVSDIFHYSQSIFNCSMSLDQHRTLNVLYSALMMFLCWLGTGRFERFVCLKYFSIIIQLLK